MVSRYMLSTNDNVWNPFTSFREWLSYDIAKGYNTLGRLANRSFSSPALSEIDREEDNERAMNEVVNNEFTHDGDKLIRFVLVPNPSFTSVKKEVISN